MKTMRPSPQKSVHINPGFLCPQNATGNNGKVHINPAFFKTQSAHCGAVPYTSTQVHPQYLGSSSQVVSQAFPLKLNPPDTARHNVIHVQAPLVGLNPDRTQIVRTEKPSVLTISSSSYVPSGHINPHHPKYISSTMHKDSGIHSSRNVFSVTHNQGTVPNSALHLNSKYKIDRTEPNSMVLHRTQHRIKKEVEVLNANKVINRYKVSNSAGSSKSADSLGTLEKNFLSIAGALHNERSHRVALPSHSESTKVRTKFKFEIEIGKKKEMDSTKGFLGCESFNKQFKVFSRSKIVRKKHLSNTSGNKSIHRIQDSTGQSNKIISGNALHRSVHTPKRRLSFLTKTKLVRRRSASNSCSGGDGKKYCIKTKTKIVKKGGGGSSQGGITNAKNTPGKVSDSKSRYAVISKTKLVRRRSSNSTSKSHSKYHPNRVGLPSCLKHWKNTKYPPLTHSAFKISPVVKAAKSIKSKYRIVNNHNRDLGGVISKYKVNRIDPNRRAKAKQPVLSKRFRNYKFNSRHKRSRYTWNKNGRVYSVSSNLKNAKRIISIGGIMYKSTKTRLQRHTRKAAGASHPAHPDIKYFVKLRGNQFIMSRNGRTLKRLQPKSLLEKNNTRGSTVILPRLHIGGRTYTQTQNGQYELTHAHQTRAALNIARQKSLAVLRRTSASMRKKEYRYCLFYNRFGRCSKKDSGECAFIHDPDKVAVCTRFLRGRCRVEGCYFSHKIDPDKMPVCSYFLRSSCIRENCPYSHVRVNPSAPVCKNFLKGHCPAGKECKNQHVFDCEEYRVNGKCSRESCPLRHRRGRRASFTRTERTSGRSKQRKRTYRSTQESSIKDPSGSKEEEGFKRLKAVVNEREANLRYFEVESELYNESAGNGEACEELGNSVLQDMEECPDKQNSTSTNTVDDKNKQLMHKTEKSSTADGDVSLSKTSGLATEKRDQNKKNEDCQSDTLCVLRKPPLPRRMPSYIPLSMDED